MKRRLKTNKGIALIAVIILIIILIIVVGVSIAVLTRENIEINMKIVGEKVTEPPVPTGFTHTEGIVDNGYVIQDESGNEFVWVPVDKNQKIEISVTSNKDIESITLQDPYGDIILTVDNEEVDKTYKNQEVTPTINGPYLLKVTTTSEEKIFTLGVHSLYAVDSVADWQFTEEMAELIGDISIEEVLQEYTLEEVYVEYAKDLKYRIEPGEDYEESVNDNGGFYIGRYEASYDNGKVASKKSTIANESEELENGKLWNWISQEDSLSYANNMYESDEFTSSLLTGAAWDRTLGWLEETGAVTAYEIVGYSKTWGNYLDDEFSRTTSIANTGEFKETEKNHIYDLAGNVKEWTTEAYHIEKRDDSGKNPIELIGYYSGNNIINRGGNYSDDGSDEPASYSSSASPGYTNSDCGFRPALYL